MVRQDDMRSIRDTKVIRRHTLLMQVVQFFDQRFGIDHHSISNYRDFFWEENSWRNQVQLVLLAVNHDSMAGIVTTLIASNHFGIGWKEVCNLPFSFISPLGSYNNYWCHNSVWAEAALPFLKSRQESHLRLCFIPHYMKNLTIFQGGFIISFVFSLM